MSDDKVERAVQVIADVLNRPWRDPPGGPYHARLDDFESFDRITFEVIPRYKQSGLSGDEWRQHVEVQFWFKGEIVHTFGAGNMRSALMIVGTEWITQQEPLPSKVVDIERDRCDQPSCPKTFTVRRLLKRHKDAFAPFRPEEAKHYRQFCEEHKRRGDADFEDSDVNYETLDEIDMREIRNAAGKTEPGLDLGLRRALDDEKEA